MIVTHHVHDTLTLDLDEGYLECPAVYRIRAEWSHGKLIHADCSLEKFWLGKMIFGWAMADQLIGAENVIRQERIICDRWAENAERDNATAAAEDRQTMSEDA